MQIERGGEREGVTHTFRFVCAASRMQNSLLTPLVLTGALPSRVCSVSLVCSATLFPIVATGLKYHMDYKYEARRIEWNWSRIQKRPLTVFFYTYSLPLSPRRHAKLLVGSYFPMTGFLRSRSGTTPNYWAALEFAADIRLRHLYQKLYLKWYIVQDLLPSAHTGGKEEKKKEAHRCYCCVWKGCGSCWNRRQKTGSYF